MACQYQDELEQALRERGTHAPDSDDDECYTDDVDPTLQLLIDSVPSQPCGIRFENHFAASDFVGTGVELWQMSQHRASWDNPPWTLDFTMDKRIEYTQSMCAFVNATCGKDAVKTNTQRLHFTLPWLGIFSNCPRAEAVYRIVLLGFECLRNSHIICCQPYNSVTATQFKAEYTRVVKTWALLIHLKGSLTSEWANVRWYEPAAMDCPPDMLASLIEWLKAYLLFMMGTQMMCKARGIEASSVGIATDKPGMDNNKLRFADLVNDVVSKTGGSASTTNTAFSVLAEMNRAALTVVGDDSEFKAMEHASAGVQSRLMPDKSTTGNLALAAACMKLAAQILSRQQTDRVPFWTERERDALKDAQVMDTITHTNTSLDLPERLAVPAYTDLQNWTQTANDDSCIDWARLPWWERLRGLWLRCLGDVYMWSSVHTVYNQPLNRARGAVCHLVAYLQFGANVVTAEEAQRSRIEHDQLHRQGDLKTIEDNESMVFRKYRSCTAVDFTFLADASIDIMRDGWFDENEAHIELNWNTLDAPVEVKMKAVSGLLAAQVTKFEPCK